MLAQHPPKFRLPVAPNTDDDKIGRASITGLMKSRKCAKEDQALESTTILEFQARKSDSRRMADARDSDELLAAF